ncbi:MAG TPA: hypothetical protein VFX56_13090, partial [Nitrospira sp.]|nr:hypothetical protein [Nitrospira sp.]
MVRLTRPNQVTVKTKLPPYTPNNARRMLKKAVRQGRSERRGEAYSVLYVESLSDARTMLADFFSIL